jgi:hypothetical protein
VTRAALALILVAVSAQLPVVAIASRRACPEWSERCRGSVIYTCTAAGRWRRGIDCARAGRRDRATVCSVEPDGSAVCVEDGGAS